MFLRAARSNLLRRDRTPEKRMIPRAFGSGADALGLKAKPRPALEPRTTYSFVATVFSKTYRTDASLSSLS